MELKLEQVIIRDDDLVVFLPEKTITEGELIIAPLYAFKTIEEMPNTLIEKMFHVLNKMSSALFDLLGCQGTNILIQNGKDAGATEETIFIRIIPRYQEDNLALKWDPKQANPQELEEMIKAFKGIDEDKARKEDEEKKQTITKQEPETMKENYLTKSLRRNP